MRLAQHCGLQWHYSFISPDNSVGIVKYPFLGSVFTTVQRVLFDIKLKRSLSRWFGEIERFSHISTLYLFIPLRILGWSSYRTISFILNLVSRILYLINHFLEVQIKGFNLLKQLFFSHPAKARTCPTASASCTSNRRWTLHRRPALVPAPSQRPRRVAQTAWNPRPRFRRKGSSAARRPLYPAICTMYP